MKPHILDGDEIESIKVDERFLKAPTLQSLLLTVEALFEARRLDADELLRVRADNAALRAQAKLHRETYSERALPSLQRSKPRPKRCPHCLQYAASHLASEWVCLSCGCTWQVIDFQI